MANEYPDPEGATRDWLRADTDVQAIVGSRTFFGVPRGATEATYPLNVVSRIGGGDDASEAPVDLALIQVECWGRIANGNGLKAECTAQANAVRTAMARLFCRTQINATTDAFGVQEAGSVWAPDPDTDRPRYVLTFELGAILR